MIKLPRKEENNTKYSPLKSKTNNSSLGQVSSLIIGNYIDQVSR